MNKTYRIPCYWQMNGSYYIEAESLEKALEIAEDSGLPEEAEFVDGSYEVDHEMVAFYNDNSNLVKEDIKIKDYFSIGSCVTAHPMPNDLFDHSFDGVVTGYHGELIIVKDQDDECFDCKASQLKFRHDCEH